MGHADKCEAGEAEIGVPDEYRGRELNRQVSRAVSRGKKFLCYFGWCQGAATQV
jgi:hypothetical protein